MAYKWSNDMIFAVKVAIAGFGHSGAVDEVGQNPHAADTLVWFDFGFGVWWVGDLF